MSQFSTTFGVTRSTEDDWFDPDLNVDTPLFLDPFLLLDEETSQDSVWSGSHGDLIAHFVRSYHLVAAGSSPTTQSARMARSLLTFPEPAELCLGYTASGTAGAGSGAGYANFMIGSIVTAIAAGLSSPSHIEEIAILNEGIGADRISDAACNILKPRIIRYTKEVCLRHHVPTQEIRVRNARCDLATGRWMHDSHQLPVSPSTGEAILLVPSRFLNHLPTLNAYDWLGSSINADLRMSISQQVSGRVPKKEIVRLARRNPDRIRKWVDQVRDEGHAVGYDFDEDPLGVVQWQSAGEAFVADNPLSLTTEDGTPRPLREFVADLIAQFKLFVEDQGGWRLLWNDDGSEKPEEAVQLAFLGLGRAQCRANGIEMDREVNFGRGPVDFKFTTGTERLLIEVKKLHNGDFWNGLENQLTSYLHSDQTDDGWLVAVRYRSEGVSAKRPADLRRRVDAVNVRLGTNIDFAVIDARRKLSASKIKSIREQ